MKPFRLINFEFPKGRLGICEVPLPPENQGCHFIPLFHLLSFFCLVLVLFLSGRPAPPPPILFIYYYLFLPASASSHLAKKVRKFLPRIPATVSSSCILVGMAPGQYYQVTYCTFVLLWCFPYFHFIFFKYFLICHCVGGMHACMCQ